MNNFGDYFFVFGNFGLMDVWLSTEKKDKRHNSIRYLRRSRHRAKIILLSSSSQKKNGRRKNCASNYTALSNVKEINSSSVVWREKIETARYTQSYVRRRRYREVIFSREPVLEVLLRKIERGDNSHHFFCTRTSQVI